MCANLGPAVIWRGRRAGKKFRHSLVLHFIQNRGTCQIDKRVSCLRFDFWEMHFCHPAHLLSRRKLKGCQPHLGNLGDQGHRIHPCLQIWSVIIRKPLKEISLSEITFSTLTLLIRAQAHANIKPRCCRGSQYEHHLTIKIVTLVSTISLALSSYMICKLCPSNPS